MWSDSRHIWVGDTQDNRFTSLQRARLSRIGGGRAEPPGANRYGNNIHQHYNKLILPASRSVAVAPIEDRWRPLAFVTRSARDVACPLSP